MSTGNIIAGHKATISNSNTSQAAKEHSRQIIQELEGPGADAYLSRQPRVDDEEEEVPIIEANPPNALGDNTQHESAPGGTEPAVDDSSFAGKDPNRVLGGFKATLHNPNTSQEAKDRAKATLHQHGVAIE